MPKSRASLLLVAPALIVFALEYGALERRDLFIKALARGFRKYGLSPAALLACAAASRIRGGRCRRHLPLVRPSWWRHKRSGC